MSLWIGLVVVVAIMLGWWIVHRSARLRREAEAREARVLEALFAARQAGGAAIDLDGVFGGPSAAQPQSADAVLRAAGVQADLVELLPKAVQPAAPQPVAGVEPPSGTQGGAVVQPPGAGTNSAAAAAPPAVSEEAGQTAAAAAAVASAPAALATMVPAPVAVGADETDRAPQWLQVAVGPPVRDLVQVFYEGRGFRAQAATLAAPPIEMVLAHKADPSRAYAFVPLADPPTATAVREIVEAARRIGQSRVLIAVEEDAPPGLDRSLSGQPVRLFDRPLIEAQLARLDGEIAAKVRAAAERRSDRRQRAATAQAART